VDAFVENNKIECEWTPRKTYDACLSDEFKAYEADALAGLRSAGGEPEGFAELSASQASEVRSGSLHLDLRLSVYPIATPDSN
jgi:hypothetical protein